MNMSWLVCEVCALIISLCLFYFAIGYKREGRIYTFVTFVASSIASALNGIMYFVRFVRKEEVDKVSFIVGIIFAAFLLIAVLIKVIYNFINKKTIIEVKKEDGVIKIQKTRKYKCGNILKFESSTTSLEKILE